MHNINDFKKLSDEELNALNNELFATIVKHVLIMVGVKLVVHLALNLLVRKLDPKN